jgi:hypothetical protein
MILRPTDGDVRYEVCVVEHVLEWDDRPTGVFAYQRREFKTSAAARAYQRTLEAAGNMTMFQVGVMVWLVPEKAAEVMDQLQREGVTWR